MTEERLRAIVAEVDVPEQQEYLIRRKSYILELADALRAAWRERDELRAVATEAQRAEASTRLSVRVQPPQTAIPTIQQSSPANSDSGRSVLDFLAGGRPWSCR
jgi:hypothetical protein